MSFPVLKKLIVTFILIQQTQFQSFFASELTKDRFRRNRSVRRGPVEIRCAPVITRDFSDTFHITCIQERPRVSLKHKSTELES